MTKTDSPAIVLTTVGSREDAGRLASEIVDARLAACVNIVEGVVSVYRWEGRVMEESELLLIIKTTMKRAAELRQHFAASHPYEVPELVVLAIDDLSEGYGKWLLESTSEG